MTVTKHQVFISSTFIDLEDERREVIQALLELDCIPAGMELFQASDDNQWALIKRVIKACDYYMVIIGGRYGSVHPVTGKSYTQMEYEFAQEMGIPTIGFVHKNPGSIAADKSEALPERRQKLEKFKELVKMKTVRYWETAHELSGVVSRSIVKLKETHPMPGWVKAQTPPELQAELAAIKAENARLQKEINALHQAAVKQPAPTPDNPKNITVLGAGNNGFNLTRKMQANGLKNVQFVYAYSKSAHDINEIKAGIKGTDLLINIVDLAESENSRHFACLVSDAAKDLDILTINILLILPHNETPQKNEAIRNTINYVCEQRNGVAITSCKSYQSVMQCVSNIISLVHEEGVMCSPFHDLAAFIQKNSILTIGYGYEYGQDHLDIAAKNACAVEKVANALASAQTALLCIKTDLNTESLLTIDRAVLTITKKANPDIKLLIGVSNYEGDERTSTVLLLVGD